MVRGARFADVLALQNALGSEFGGEGCMSFGQ
jgi:hypothetical protein